MGLTYDLKASTLNREIWTHVPALYQVRKQGTIAYSFLRNESVPVHYRPGKEPLRPPGGLEWNARLFDFRDDFARDYDLVLVRQKAGPNGEVTNPAQLVFGAWAEEVHLLSQRGAFFLYDASKVNQAMSRP